jgi:predicted CXXCH cytochrome family protein
MREMFRNKEHLFRMAGLFLLGVLLFLGLRAILVPKGFGTLGHYRPGAVDDNMNRTPAFAGKPACLECHTDMVATQKGSKHAAINCEACHGAQGAHAANPEKKPVRPDPKAICLVCHTQNVAKPKKFPQIDPKAHMDGGSCNECHSPHNPEKGPVKAPDKPSAQEAKS